MGPSDSVAVPSPSDTAHPSVRRPSRALASVRRCSTWIASVVLIVLLPTLIYAQLNPAPQSNPGATFESIPPTPYSWGIPVESVPDTVSPFSPVDCFAEAFAKHHATLQLLGGAYFSPVGLGPKTQPRFNFAPIDLRLGCMLYSPCPDDCCLRGNIEALLELTAAPVIYGFGDIVTGPTILLRYNFVQPDWRLVPYLQAGGGFTYNDGYRDKSQRALGQAGEFYLQATAGFHYLLSSHCSIDLEGGYLHISNAGTNDRNGGINALGGSLGITYFFGKRHD